MERHDEMRHVSVRLPATCEVPSCLLNWPGLSGDTKLVAIWLWNNVGCRPGRISVRMVDIAAAQGKSTERSARRWMEYLEEEGLVDVEHQHRGLLVIHVHDPYDVHLEKTKAMSGSAKKTGHAREKKTTPAKQGKK